MNILILVFSPSGSTLKIGKMLDSKLKELGNSVQFLDITRNREIFKQGLVKKYLEKNVKKHDIICIGSPVYEKHIEMYMKLIYANLPKPNEIWGEIAIPFFTFGGISSGIALNESYKMLKKSGRKVIAAMKIEASHIVTKKLKTRVNENMPGDEAYIYVNELAQIINSKSNSKGITIKDLNYQSRKEKVVSRIMIERVLHDRLYGKLTIKDNLCTSCMACINTCPIQRIDEKNKKAVMDKNAHACIHCFSCVNVCQNNAITYENGEDGWNKIERIFGKVAKENSFFRSTEYPKSIVFSNIKKETSI